MILNTDLVLNIFKKEKLHIDQKYILRLFKVHFETFQLQRQTYKKCLRLFFLFDLVITKLNHLFF